MNDSTTATYMRLKKKIMLNKNLNREFKNTWIKCILNCMFIIKLQIVMSFISPLFSFLTPSCPFHGCKAALLQLHSAQYDWTNPGRKIRTIVEVFCKRSWWVIWSNPSLWWQRSARMHVAVSGIGMWIGPVKLFIMKQWHKITD